MDKNKFSDYTNWTSDDWEEEKNFIEEKASKEAPELAHRIRSRLNFLEFENQDPTDQVVQNDINQIIIFHNIVMKNINY